MFAFAFFRDGDFFLTLVAFFAVLVFLDVAFLGEDSVLFLADGLADLFSPRKAT